MNAAFVMNHGLPGYSSDCKIGNRKIEIEKSEFEKKGDFHETMR